ncbi:MAG: hypothetical protein Q8R53_03160 [Nanoarchaeota archaeon]|nr:hypothetical protein [Nanoarchaeota archaeon]
MAEKSHMPYLAIVVLVAVVAVVVLVLNVRPSSEEAVAGEAIRPTVVDWGEKVLFMMENAIVVGRNAGVEPYMDCDQICAPKQCVAAYERMGDGWRPVSCLTTQSEEEPSPPPAIACRCAGPSK